MKEANGNTTLYATSSDFCRIFAEDMKNLYLLALLLTADAEKAEQCFVSGLEESSAGNQVFTEWAQSWARRTIIKNAIRLVAPVARDSGPLAAKDAGKQLLGDHAQPELRTALAPLFDLQPFERFVFVMSVLEGYSTRDCTLLLGCTLESLLAARVRAMQVVGQNQILSAAGDGESMRIGKLKKEPKAGWLLATAPTIG